MIAWLYLITWRWHSNKIIIVANNYWTLTVCQRDSALSSFHELAHWVLTTTLWDRYYYEAHFIDEKSGAVRLRTLSQIIKLIIHSRVRNSNWGILPTDCFLGVCVCVYAWVYSADSLPGSRAQSCLLEAGEICSSGLAMCSVWLLCSSWPSKLASSTYAIVATTSFLSPGSSSPSEF